MLHHLVTPGDACKDTLLAGAGFSPALFLAHVETALIIGVLNLVVVVIFRGVELWLKYGRKSKGPNDAEPPRQD